MPHGKTGDFCEGESQKHCGCMHASTRTSLAVKLIQSYGRTVPAGIRKYYDAYNKNPSPENSSALCETVWNHINPDLRAFMQTYQQDTSKNDIQKLIDKLLKTDETTDDEHGARDTRHKEHEKDAHDVNVLVVHI
jgi:hypothetical protein